MWVGLGCGLTVLLAFGGCVALMGVIGQRAAQEIRKPLTQKETIAKLGDIPIYQPSTFNEPMTRGVRFGSSLFPGEMMTAAAFDTSAQPDQIIDWYQQRLTKKGFQTLPQQPSFATNTRVATFRKGSESIIVQIEDAKRGEQKHTLILMRMKRPNSKPGS